MRTIIRLHNSQWILSVPPIMTAPLLALPDIFAIHHAPHHPIPKEAAPAGKTESTSKWNPIIITALLRTTWTFRLSRSIDHLLTLPIMASSEYHTPELTANPSARTTLIHSHSQ